MKKTPFLVFVGVLLAMLIVPAFAETTTLRINVKAATACVIDGSSYAVITASEMTRPTKIMLLQFILQDNTNGVSIVEQRELASNEFSWSLGVCKLNAEIAGFALVVEWKAVSPPRSDHTNEKIEIWWTGQGTVHCVFLNVLGISTESTLSWNGYTMRGEGVIGLSNCVNVIHAAEDLPPPIPPPPSPP